MKYIDAEKLIARIKELNLVTKTYEEQVAFNNALAMVVEIIDSLQQEQESVAERFARIVRGNLSKIDKEVQQKFEQLYFEVTGNKMYGGYND